MSTPRSIAELPVGELLTALAAAHVSPGAGSAGAVALALAAACAMKAVSISLKHDPDDASLAPALVRLSRLASDALGGADRDAHDFETFVHTHDAAAGRELVHTDEHLEALVDALVRELDDIEPHIAATMAGDVVAARALAEAARIIQKRNVTETEQALPASPPAPR